MRNQRMPWGSGVQAQQGDSNFLDPVRESRAWCCRVAVQRGGKRRRHLQACEIATAGWPEEEAIGDAPTHVLRSVWNRTLTSQRALREDWS